MILPFPSLYRYTPGPRGKRAACSRRALTDGCFRCGENYNKSMSRWRISTALPLAAWAMLGAGLAVAQDAASSNGLPPPLVPKTEMPPEEDKTNAPRTYTFNPVESQHMVVV